MNPISETSPAPVSWENDHNVYILGAGFSADSGIPVVGSFLQRMREASAWLQERGRHQEVLAIHNVMAFRRQAAGAAYYVRLNLDDIETLFSLAAAQGISQREDVVRAICATIDFCATTQNHNRAVVIGRGLSPEHKPRQWRRLDKGTHGAPHTFRYEAPQSHVYAGLLGGRYCDTTAGAKNTVLTFNYDTLVEDSWAAIGQRFSYSLPDGTDIALEAATNPGPTDPCILKLHGSMNWSSTQGGHLRVDPSYEKVRRGSGLPLIVPPTWQKEFAGPLAQVWASAVTALTTATRIFIVGFSLPETDTHFRYLLAAGLRDNVSLRGIWYVNPEADSPRMQRRLRHVFNISDERNLHFRASRANDYFLTNRWGEASRPMAPFLQVDASSLISAGKLVSPDAPNLE